MRSYFHFEVLLFLALCAGSAMGQQPSAEEEFVIVPREVGLVTVAYQPDCPLVFENVRFLAGVKGGGVTSYDLRNRGTKSIRAFKVADSMGSTLSWDVARYCSPVPPGESVPLAEPGKDSSKIVPLTSELREKLKLQGPMQGLVVLMVVRVEFTDGTIYDDEIAFKAMRSYMDETQGKLNLLESLKKKSK